MRILNTKTEVTMRTIIVAIVLVTVASAIDVPISRNCAKLHPNGGFADNYYENMAHAVHSMNLPGLQRFNQRATIKNSIPTVNLNVSAANKVIPFAPDFPMTRDYSTFTMNLIDTILSHVGVQDDGLGPAWSPVERIAHMFHMIDLWETIRPEFDRIVMYNPTPKETCDCLLDVKNNGVEESVRWVAEHYKKGTPITLLNRPIPELTDAGSWKVWKARLLHYYTAPALKDAAQYLFCATRGF